MDVFQGQRLDHFFRHQHGVIVSMLVSRYGVHHLSAIEDSIQEALIKAMQLWPYKGWPKNPEAWLYRVASNGLIDHLRKDNKHQTLYADSQDTSYTSEEPVIPGEINDEQLKMMFACCHPDLSQSERVILSLRYLGGLSVREISSALLKQEEATKKALSRAKANLKSRVGHLQVPAGASLLPRMESVLKTIFLIFNEGYKAAEGEVLIKKDLCLEAIRLAWLLHENPMTKSTELSALLSLMCFKVARFESRIDLNGYVITLENQSRENWDHGMISMGIKFLQESAQGEILSEYHLHAGIESYYCTAQNFASVNWKEILEVYDRWVEISDALLVRLNRIVIVEKVHGPVEALKQLSALNRGKDLNDHYLFQAILAEVHCHLEHYEMALSCIDKAISLVRNNVEKKFLRHKRDEWRKRYSLN